MAYHRKSEMKRLRTMSVYATAVDSIRHVAVLPEVQEALLKWIKTKTGPVAPGVLIGGLAMSFYAKPRYTQDVDLLFLSSADIPMYVEGFKRTRPGAFHDKSSHAEIEVDSAKSFDSLPQQVAEKVFETAVVYSGIRVASREGMLALKLYAAHNPKRRHKDLGDVQLLIEGMSDPEAEMKDWLLIPSALAFLRECIVLKNQSL